MSTVNDTDLLLVNRGGSSYNVQVKDMSTVQDTDLLLINRNGVSYKVEAQYLPGGELEAPVIQSVALTENNSGGYRFQNQIFRASLDMNPDGFPPSDKYLKPYVQGGLTVALETDTVTGRVDNNYTFATDSSLDEFSSGMPVKQDAPYTPTTSEIIQVQQEQNVITGTVNSGNNNASGSVESIFNGSTSGGSGVNSSYSGGFYWTFDNLKITAGQKIEVYSSNEYCPANITWSNGTCPSLPNNAPGDWYDITPNISSGSSNLTQISSNGQSNKYGLNLNAFRIDGDILDNSRIYNVCACADDTDLQNFQSGDLTSRNDGSYVSSVSSITNQITLVGGTWSVGDRVGGQVINGTGTVSSVNAAGKSMELDGRFAVGSVIETDGKVFVPSATMYLILASNGQVIDMRSSDPGYTKMDSDSVNQSFAFGNAFPTGEPVDDELPIGTTIRVDVKADNVLDTPSTKTSNLLTPT